MKNGLLGTSWKPLMDPWNSTTTALIGLGDCIRHLRHLASHFSPCYTTESNCPVQGWITKQRLPQDPHESSQLVVSCVTVF